MAHDHAKDKMSDDEKKMRGEMDLRTLIDAEKIKKDPERMKVAMQCRKEMMDSLKKVEA